jgi:CheY-like chemotaxis protein
MTAAAVPDESAPRAVAGGGVVLLVDDDDDVRQITAGMLRELGYRVIEANGGSGALQALETAERIDLLIVDYAMPDLTGAEVVRRALIGRPDLRILFMTGYADASTLDRDAPDQPVIKKPFRMAEFSAAVRAALIRVVSRSGNVLPLRPHDRRRDSDSA